MKWAIISCVLLTQPIWAVFVPLGKSKYKYQASIFRGENCTGEEHVGAPFVKFSCHRQCHSSDGSLSVYLDGRTYIPHSSDITYQGITEHGPMAVLYRTTDCSGDPIGEARIPRGYGDACMTLPEPAHSFQFLFLRDCGKKKFLRVGTNGEKPEPLPNYVDWNDPENKTWVIGNHNQYVYPDD